MCTKLKLLCSFLYGLRETNPQFKLAQNEHIIMLLFWVWSCKKKTKKLWDFGKCTEFTFLPRANCTLYHSLQRGRCWLLSGPKVSLNKETIHPVALNVGITVWLLLCLRQSKPNFFPISSVTVSWPLTGCSLVFIKTFLAVIALIYTSTRKWISVFASEVKTTLYTLHLPLQCVIFIAIYLLWYVSLI